MLWDQKLNKKQNVPLPVLDSNSFHAQSQGIFTIVSRSETRTIKRRMIWVSQSTIFKFFVVDKSH